MQTDEYLKLAAIEDRLCYFRALHAHIARELERAHLPAHASLLDIGCGTGGLILRLSPQAPQRRWTGLDFSPLACDLARKRCPGTTSIVEGSATALPFADASFDAAISADVLCQFDDPSAAVQEMFRVLRPGAFAIINVPAYQWLWSYHDAATHGKRRYTCPEIAARLRAAGFEIDQLTYRSALAFPFIWAKRKLLPGSRDSSDVHENSALIDAVYSTLAAIESVWFRLGGRFAWGSSVFAVARKPAASPSP